MSINSRAVQTNIEGVSYQAVKLPAGVAFMHGTFLLKSILPSLGAGIDGSRAEEWEAPTTFTEMALHLCSRLDEDRVLKIVKDLCNDLYADGKKATFDDYFSGQLDVLILVLEWLFKENFGSFFENASLRMKLKHWIKNLFPSQQEEQQAE